MLRTRIESRTAAARPEFAKWLAGQTRDSLAVLIPARELRLHLESSPRDDAAPGEGRSHVRPSFESADSGDFERKDAFSFGAWIKLPKGGLYGSVVARMDDQHDYRGWDLWVEGRKVATHLVNKWPENALKVVGRGELPLNTWTHVLVTYDGSSQAAGVKIYINGELQDTEITANRLNSTIRTSVPLKVGQRHTSRPGSTVSASATCGSIAWFSQPARPPISRPWAAPWRFWASPCSSVPEEDTEALLIWWLKTRDPGSRELQARYHVLQQEEAAIRSRGTVAHVMQERTEPAMAFVLYRGEYDKRRDQVKADTPDVLPPMPAELPRNRLGLARWLLRPEHPLTARVTVNRFWQEVFGTGLVRTAGDFGVSGELPSHPELLDWLATEFRETGWDVKRFFRLLVTSATYRQSAASTPEKIEKDPQQSASFTRAPLPDGRGDDPGLRPGRQGTSWLARVGGPSARPYQPEGVWEAVAMPESNTRIYERDHGENLYRRSLYTFWKRAAPPASMEIFNAPSREVCTVRRERTNTPLQALVTLNDPQFIEAARALAQLTLEQAGEGLDSRIDFIARRLLSRPLQPAEQQVVRDSAERLIAFYQSHPEDAIELLAVGELKPSANQEPAMRGRLDHADQRADEP